MSVIRRIGRVVRNLAFGESAAGAPTVPGDEAPRPPLPSLPPEPQSPRGDVSPSEYIDKVIKEHTVTIFMKGTLSAPQCGFSANAAGILAAYDAIPHAVDVLLDSEVRELVKEVSGWPTIPQIYIGGEFVGGSDILAQLHENGEIKALVDKALDA